MNLRQRSNSTWRGGKTNSQTQYSLSWIARAGSSGTRHTGRSPKFECAQRSLQAARVSAEAVAVLARCYAGITAGLRPAFQVCEGRAGEGLQSRLLVKLN